MDPRLAKTMDAYHIHRGADARQAKGIVLYVAVGVLVWVALSIFFARIEVTVDGVRRSVPAGTTAKQLLSTGYVKATRGDLRSLTGGIAKRAAGLEPTIDIDGKRVEPSARVSQGAVVVSHQGADVTEAAVTTLAATPVPVVEEGRGPDATIDSIGSPGLAIVRMGEVSHAIVESTTIVAAAPMTIRRSPLSPSSMVVALTFDDGPWPGQTARILDILKAEDVKATFFMLGIRVRQHPELARRIVEEGHSVGSHSMTHPNLARSAPAVVQNQMAGAQAIIRDVTGVQPVWFRAPGGSVNGVVQAQAAALGMRIVRWTDDPSDWRKPPPGEIVGRVMGGIVPGAVVLLHDGGGDRNATIAALPEIIRMTRERGFRFVTLDEMYAQ